MIFVLKSANRLTSFLKWGDIECMTPSSKGAHSHCKYKNRFAFALNVFWPPVWGSKNVEIVKKIYQNWDRNLLFAKYSSSKSKIKM